jgi:hypothetical protein
VAPVFPGILVHIMFHFHYFSIQKIVALQCIFCFHLRHISVRRYCNIYQHCMFSLFCF